MSEAIEPQPHWDWPESQRDAPEVWKLVVGKVGYEVSNRGRIRRIGGTVILKVHVNGSVAFNAAGSSGGVMVRTAVYCAFVGPIPEGCVVYHRNGDRNDFHLGNLYVGRRRGRTATGKRSNLTDRKTVKAAPDPKGRGYDWLTSHQMKDDYVAYVTGAAGPTPELEADPFFARARRDREIWEASHADGNRNSLPLRSIGRFVGVLYMTVSNCLAVYNELRKK